MFCATSVAASPPPPLRLKLLKAIVCRLLTATRIKLPAARWHCEVGSTQHLGDTPGCHRRSRIMRDKSIMCDKRQRHGHPSSRRWDTLIQLSS